MIDYFMGLIAREGSMCIQLMMQQGGGIQMR